jgi:hypothetical protein
MKKYIYTITAMLACASVSACTNTHSAADLPEGEYEKTTVTKDASGTKYKTTTTTDVEVDKYGNRTATVETESSKDPRGLFNKTTTESKTVIKK